ncbi:MAG: DUF3352 domain-containing protein [Limisphaerales bacterium]
MKFKHSLACLWTAAALALALPSRAAVPPAEKLLPADTLLMLTIPDWDRTAAAAKDFSLAQLWRDPAMRPFAEKLELKLRELIGEQEKNFEKDWAEFKPLVGGQVTLGVLRGDWLGDPATGPDVVVLLDVKDKSKQLHDFIERCEKRDADADKPIQRETVRGVKFARTVVKQADDAPKKKQPYVGQSGSLLLLSESTKALEKVLARLEGAGAGLDESPEFERARTTVGRDAHAFGWVNVKALTGVLAKMPAPQQDGNPLAMSMAPGRIIDALGLGGLDGVVFAVRQLPEGTQGELFIQAPQARRKGLVSLLTLEPREAGPLPTVAGDATKFTRIRLDGQKAFATLERILTDLNPQMAGIVTLMMENVGKEKDPNFDLRKQIIGNLGADFVTVQKAPRGRELADLGSPPTLFLIGSPKPEALLKALLTINPLPPKEREFMGRKIYSLSPLPGLPSPGGRGVMNLSTAGGYLAVSTDVAMLEEAVRGEAQGKPLSEVPGLADAAKRVGGFNTGWFAYENQSETLRLLLETLKKDPGAVEKLFASPLPGTGGSIPSLQPLKALMDFSLLPPFDAISKYFGYTVHATTDTPEGINFKAFTPVPAGLKK